jgi:hypothetical protein
MARKKKQEKKEAVKFEKFLPGESTWKGRKNKTRQDAMPAGARPRAHAQQDRVEWAQDTKPSCVRHWARYHGD